MALLRNLLSATFFFAIYTLGRSNAEHTASESEEQLVREVLFQPEVCDRKTNKHDMVSMHYTGTLTATGVKFDSR